MRTREWSTQSGDLYRFGHAFLHGDFGVVGKLGLNHVPVANFSLQIVDQDVKWMIHKSLAK